MIDTPYAVGTVIGMAVVTVLLRAVPFIGARWLKRWPIVEDLGRFLPPVIMTLLLLHTLRGSAAEHAGGPVLELCAIGLTLLLQLRWRQPLMSILAGTALYVVLRMVPLGF